MKLLCLMALATIVSACPLSDLALVESHPYANKIKGKGEKAHGTRSFREINQTMSRVTGIDSNNQQVSRVYTDVSEMLPRDNAIDSFSGPVQVGIVRLATEYCNQLFLSQQSQQLRRDKWSEIDFNSTATVEKRPQVATLFIDNFWGPAYRTSTDGQLAVTNLVNIIDQEMLEATKGRRLNNNQQQALLNNIMMSLCTTTLASAPLMFF